MCFIYQFIWSFCVEFACEGVLLVLWILHPSSKALFTLLWIYSIYIFKWIFSAFIAFPILTRPEVLVRNIAIFFQRIPKEKTFETNFLTRHRVFQKQRRRSLFCTFSLSLCALETQTAGLFFFVCLASSRSCCLLNFDRVLKWLIKEEIENRINKKTSFWRIFSHAKHVLFLYFYMWLIWTFLLPSNLAYREKK